jgi:hypothetical protein
MTEKPSDQKRGDEESMDEGLVESEGEKTDREEPKTFFPFFQKESEPERIHEEVARHRKITHCHAENLGGGEHEKRDPKAGRFFLRPEEVMDLKKENRSGRGEDDVEGPSDFKKFKDREEKGVNGEIE